jgi:hypothetical protein
MILETNCKKCGKELVWNELPDDQCDLICPSCDLKNDKIELLYFDNQQGERLPPSNLELADKINEIINILSLFKQK